MQGSMEEPQRAAPAPALPTSRPEPVDFTEALLSSEKLPLDLQDDIPAGSSQVLLHPACMRSPFHKRSTVPGRAAVCQAPQSLQPSSADRTMPFHWCSNLKSGTVGLPALTFLSATQATGEPGPGGHATDRQQKGEPSACMGACLELP